MGSAKKGGGWHPATEGCKIGTPPPSLTLIKGMFENNDNNNDMRCISKMVRQVNAHTNTSLMTNDLAQGLIFKNYVSKFGGGRGGGGGGLSL